MIEKFEYKGLWFLPSNIESKVPGILKYDHENDKNVLELIGSFNGYQNNKEEIILGITTDGDEITLVDCYFSASTSTTENKKNSLSTLNFRITSILKGRYILKHEDLVFQKIDTEIFNLDEWIGISGLRTESNYKNNTKTIYYKTPEKINAKIDKDFDIEIKFISNYPIQSGFTKELGLSQRAVFSIHSQKYTTIHEFIYLVKKFNNFLSSSLQKPVRIKNIKLYCDKFNEVHNDNVFQKSIDVFQIINPELKFEEKKQDWEMLFTYNDIKDNFETIIQKWFSNYEKFEAPFNLVLNQYYVSIYFLENLFINVAQAAESFHRRLDIKEDMPKTEQDEEFNNKVNKIVESAPEELKNWVKSQILKPPKHFYDTRLNYILKEFSNVELDKMIGNHLTFIKDVVKSRNYYTHYNKEQGKDAAKDIELIQLYQKLRLLLICGFLIESGFEKSLLEKLIKEKAYNVFRYLMN